MYMLWVNSGIVMKRKSVPAEGVRHDISYGLAFGDGPCWVYKNPYQRYKLHLRDIPEGVTGPCILEWFRTGLGWEFEYMDDLKIDSRSDTRTLQCFITFSVPEECIAAFNCAWYWSFSRWVQIKEKNRAPTDPVRQAILKKDWMVHCRWVTNDRYVAQASDPARFRAASSFSKLVDMRPWTAGRGMALGDHNTPPAAPDTSVPEHYNIASDPELSDDPDSAPAARMEDLSFS